MDTLIGQVLSEKYLLTELLGEGGLGQVYLARALPEGTPCAVKVLHAALAEDDHHLARFEQEARAALRVSHPNSVRFLDFGAFDTPTGRAPFLVMEYLPGETLYRRLQQQGRFSPEEAVFWLSALLEVLSSLHDQGILHRDLKPENVMLVQTPDGQEQLKLLDFGVAKLLDSPGLTKTGQLMGTPYYMAPEQIDGRKTIGASADLYAVGVMAFELLTGEVPFAAASHLDIFRMHFTEAPPTLQSRLGDLPAVVPFEPVLQKALAKEPADRYPTARALSQALTAALLASQQVPAGQRREPRMRRDAGTPTADAAGGARGEEGRGATREARGGAVALPPTARHAPPRLVAPTAARPFEAETRGAVEETDAGGWEGAARFAAESPFDEDQGDSFATAVSPPCQRGPWEDDVSAETAAVLLVEATVRMPPLAVVPASAAKAPGSSEDTVKMAALPAFLLGEEGGQANGVEAAPGAASPPRGTRQAQKDTAPRATWPTGATTALARTTAAGATPQPTPRRGRWRAFLATLLRALPRWLARRLSTRHFAL